MNPRSGRYWEVISRARRDGKVLETAVPPLEGRVVEWAPRTVNDRGAYLEPVTGTRYATHQVRVRVCGLPVETVGFSVMTWSPPPCVLDLGHLRACSVRRAAPKGSSPIEQGAHREEADRVVVERMVDGRTPARVNPQEVREATRLMTARGLSARQIADLIGCTPRTVIRHRVACRKEGTLV